MQIRFINVIMQNHRGWTFCTLLVAHCLLLFWGRSICSLLVTFCSLLFARRLLPFARRSLLFACYLLLFRPNYCNIKLLWTAKEWFDYNENPKQMLPLQIFWMVVFKVFSSSKTIFKVDIKSQMLPESITLWFLYYKYLDTFLSTFMKLKSQK